MNNFGKLSYQPMINLVPYEWELFKFKYFSCKRNYIRIKWYKVCCILLCVKHQLEKTSLQKQDSCSWLLNKVHCLGILNQEDDDWNGMKDLTLANIPNLAEAVVVWKYCKVNSWFHARNKNSIINYWRLWLWICSFRITDTKLQLLDNNKRVWTF